MGGRGGYGVESLEGRMLLTTVRGGDTFEFRQTDAGGDADEDDIIRVKLEGNITAELIGAQVTGGRTRSRW
jgi:hypothetical protein